MVNLYVNIILPIWLKIHRPNVFLFHKVKCLRPKNRACLIFFTRFFGIGRAICPALLPVLHSAHWGINLPQKHHPHLLRQAPPLNMQTA